MSERRLMLTESASAPETLTQFRRRTVREYLIRTLAQAGGTVSAAAAAAGRNRTNFYRLLTQYEVPYRQDCSPEQLRKVWLAHDGEVACVARALRVSVSTARHRLLRAGLIRERQSGARHYARRAERAQ